MTFSSALFIVLTSPYHQNPASVLGHVFLLQADSSLPYPLWNTVEFVAEAEDASVFSYLTKGVYGGFAANYQMMPYYEKYHKYAEKEKRELFIYPLKISNEELARFNDTLNVWKAKEDSYKFFTNNCVDGIYALLKSTLDSIPEAPFPLTPQNLIRLLNESGRIESPLSQDDMQMPHKYSRLDVGMLFLEKPYANLRFRLFLHDMSDNGGYYSNKISFELLVLSLYFNSNRVNLKELWFMRLRSEVTSNNFITDWSWFVESGIEVVKTTNVGLGKTYAVFGDYLLGYLWRCSMLEAEKKDYYAGFQVFTRGFSAKRYRFGVSFDYLRLPMRSHAVKTDLRTWLSLDLGDDWNLFAESSIKNDVRSFFSLMFRYYWGI